MNKYMSALDASLTYSLTRFSHMAVRILLMNNTQSQLRKGDYVDGICVKRSIHYANVKGRLRKGTRAMYISLRSACTQWPLLSVNYLEGDSLPPLAYVQCTKGYPEKYASVQGRGKVHTQFLFFISLMLLIGGCVHITSDRAIVQSKPPVVIDLTPTPEKTFTHCNPPACEEVDPAERMKGHACDSKPTSCI